MLQIANEILMRIKSKAMCFNVWNKLTFVLSGEETGSSCCRLFTRDLVLLPPVIALLCWLLHFVAVKKACVCNVVWCWRNQCGCIMSQCRLVLISLYNISPTLTARRMMDDDCGRRRSVDIMTVDDRMTNGFRWISPQAVILSLDSGHSEMDENCQEFTI